MCFNMGRVRRYKKAKSDDISHNRKRSDKKSVQHNLPPGTSNHEAQRLKEDGTVKFRQKRKLPKWAQEELRETAKQERESSRFEPDAIGEQHMQPVVKDPVHKVESKQPGESLRAFNVRLKAETAHALREEFKRNSATLARRRGHLAEKTKKKRMQKAGLWDAHVAQKHADKTGASQDMQFAMPEIIQFGETVDAPPRFTSVPKLKRAKSRVTGKPWLSNLNVKNDTHTDMGTQRPHAEKHTQDKFVTAKQAAKRAEVAQEFKQKSHGSSDALHSSVNSSSESEHLKAKQFEQVRQATLQAYADLKKRRRNGNTQCVAHSL